MSLSKYSYINTPVPDSSSTGSITTGSAIKSTPVGLQEKIKVTKNIWINFKYL